MGLMRNYISIKAVTARPMNKSQFEKDTGRRILEGSAEAEGYTIKYSDGYKSWCPKEIFDRDYILNEKSVMITRKIDERVSLLLEQMTDPVHEVTRLEDVRNSSEGRIILEETCSDPRGKYHVVTTEQKYDNEFWCDTSITTLSMTLMLEEFSQCTLNRTVEHTDDIKSLLQELKTDRCRDKVGKLPEMYEVTKEVKLTYENNEQDLVTAVIKEIERGSGFYVEVVVDGDLMEYKLSHSIVDEPTVELVKFLVNADSSSDLVTRNGTPKPITKAQLSEIPLDISEHQVGNKFLVTVISEGRTINLTLSHSVLDADTLKFLKAVYDSEFDVTVINPLESIALPGETLC